MKKPFDVGAVRKNQKSRRDRSQHLEAHIVVKQPQTYEKGQRRTDGTQGHIPSQRRDKQEHRQRNQGDAPIDDHQCRYARQHALSPLEMKGNRIHVPQ